jgi:hypothetical protein
VDFRKRANNTAEVPEAILLLIIFIFIPGPHRSFVAGSSDEERWG